MKKSFFRSTLVATFAMSVLLFTACKKEKMDTPPPVKSYIGEWAYEGIEENHSIKDTITLKDNIFQYKGYVKEGDIYDFNSSFKGTFSVDEKAMTFQISFTEFTKKIDGVIISLKKGDPNFETEVARMDNYKTIGYLVSGDKLTLLQGDNKTTLTRVKK